MSNFSEMQASYELRKEAEYMATLDSIDEEEADWEKVITECFNSNGPLPYVGLDEFGKEVIKYQDVGFVASEEVSCNGLNQQFVDVLLNSKCPLVIKLKEIILKNYIDFNKSDLEKFDL